MQRDNRENEEVRITERERKDMNNSRKNPDPMSQLLMWLLPVLLLGILVYYIYQRYYMPSKETPAVTTEVKTVETAAPAATTAPAAETKPASEPKAETGAVAK